MTAAERTAYHTRYACRRRELLVRQLSPELRCAQCGEVHTIDNLDIDHMDGRLWRIDTVSASQRVARYWREFKAGVRMRVLCHPCSGRDGGRRRYDVPRE